MLGPVVLGRSPRRMMVHLGVWVFCGSIACLEADRPLGVADDAPDAPQPGQSELASCRTNYALRDRRSHSTKPALEELERLYRLLPMLPPTEQDTLQRAIVRGSLRACSNCKLSSWWELGVSDAKVLWPCVASASLNGSTEEVMFSCLSSNEEANPEAQRPACHFLLTAK